MDEGPEVWRKLGIERTGSSRAIRAAYLRKLRAVDVDAGAVGFVALRDAYEAALASTKRLQLVGSWLDGARDGAGQRDYPREQAPPDAWFAVALPPRAEAFADGLPPEIGELDLIFATVAGEDRRWLSADEKVELRRCWAAVAAAADAAQRDAIERAILWLIVNWGPFAVGLAAFAAEHFHWDTERAPDEDDAMLAEALWRARAIRFLQRVRRPGHPHHSAWIELTSPVGPDHRRGRCDPARVHELQAVARSVWPEVESEFDPARVALWKNNTADPSHLENANRKSSLLRNVVMTIASLILLWWIASIILGPLRAVPH